MKDPLVIGAYQAASVIASAQRCVNLYLEKNPDDSEFPFKLYPTPGLVTVGTAPERGYRGAYVASSGHLFVCVGRGIYRVSSAFSFTLLGSITTTATPVSMSDNAVTLVIVDGSINGYKVDLKTFAWSVITAADTDSENGSDTVSPSAFYGSDSVDFVDVSADVKMTLSPK